MYRTNSQSRIVEKTFLRRRLPHRVVGMRFFERKEIKDVLGYVRLCHNPRDVASFDRVVNVPARQIGAKTLADLRDWSARLGVTPPEAVLLLADNQPLPVPCPVGSRARTALADFGRCLADLMVAASERTVEHLIEAILERTGYLQTLRDGTQDGESREENVRELIRVAAEFGHTDPASSLEAFLEDAALAADADEYDASADAVTLITLHAAKGLEFGTVFIIGLEEGMCPHSRSVDEPAQLEEERRLLYVGMTRARQRLYLTYAARRAQFGESSGRTPSRFFRDLPRELLQGTASAIQGKRRDWVDPPTPEERQTPPLRLTNAPAAAVAQSLAQAALGPGQKVRHATFGEGIVVAVQVRGGDQEVTVAFPNLPVKKLLQSYAKLQVL
jgi:DNA helicase-2/ATP-dependent DNA helicase PcrA